MSHTWNDDSEELAWYRENCAGLNPAAYRACVEALQRTKKVLSRHIEKCEKSGVLIGCLEEVEIALALAHATGGQP